MVEKLRVYFACAIRGEQGGAEEKELIVRTIQNLGHEVLSERFLGQDIKVNELGQGMSPEEICQRDLDWITMADVLVADVSRISHGVGFEIGWAASKGKPVTVLCREDKYDGLSNMLKGFGGTVYSFPGEYKLHSWRGLEYSDDLRKILESELGDATIFPS